MSLFLWQTSFLHPASSGSEAIQQLFVAFLWVAGVVLVVVTGLVTYFSHRYRASPRRYRPGDDTEPKQIHTHRGLEIGILAIMTAVMGVFFYLTIQTMLSVQAAPAKGQSPDLVITGHQWWWEARYLPSGVVAANEIHIPTGKKLLLQLESADVIHDWWVPRLGRKMDMIPGVTNQVWMEAQEPGTYLGACSEFCGAQHAGMRIQVIAHAPEEFAAWEQAQQKTPGKVARTLVKTGEALFQGKTCVNCHAVAGTVAKANIGPNLTHVGSRKTLLTGLLDNTPENMGRWLKDPQAVKPGAHMPNFIFTPDEVNALVAYLESLK